MKRFALILLLGLIDPLPCDAQDQPELGPGNVGFVTVLNALSTGAPTGIAVGAFQMNGGAEVAPGDSTGSLGFLAGDYVLMVRNPACVPATFQKPLSVAGGTAQAVVVYADSVRRGDSVVPVINTATLSQGAERAEVCLSLLSLSARPEIRVQVRSEWIALRPKMPRAVTVKSREVVPYRLEKSGAGDTIELGSDGQFLLVVFDDAPTGRLRSGILAHVKVELDLPLPPPAVERAARQEEGRNRP